MSAILKTTSPLKPISNFWEAWDMLKKEHLKGAQAVDKDLVLWRN